MSTETIENLVGDEQPGWYSGKAAICALIVTGMALRILFFTVFEYTSDQEGSMEVGRSARDASFIVACERANSTGLCDPPGFAWYMGATTSISQDPVMNTAFMSGINMLVLAWTVILLYRILPAPFAFMASLFTSINPAYVINSNKLWEPSLLPLFLLPFFVKLSDFMRRKDPFDIFWVLLLAGLATQMHMAGLFLFPVIILLAISRGGSIDLKPAAVAIAALVILYSPYLYHLLFDGGLDRLMAVSDEQAKRDVGLRALTMNMSTPSIEYLYFYFVDFDSVLRRGGGNGAHIWRLVSSMLNYTFAAGLVAYLYLVISSRNIFDYSKNARIVIPPTAQVMAFAIICVSLIFVALKIVSFPHHMLAFYPGHAVIAALPLWLIWKAGHARAAVIPVAVLMAGANIWLMVALFNVIHDGGGHNDFYGVNAARLSQIKEAVWKMTPDGMAPQVRPYIHHMDQGSQNQPPRVFRSFIEAGADENADRFPIDLHVVWIGRDWEYKWTARPVNLDKERRVAESFKKGASGLPGSAFVHADPSFLRYFGGPNLKRKLDLRMPIDSVRPDCQYIAAYTGNRDEPVLDLQKKSLLDIATGREFGVTFYENGALTAKRGGSKTEADRRLFTDFFNYVDIINVRRNTGDLVFMEDSLGGFAIQARRGESREGFMAFGNYEDLMPGKYTARFRIKAANMAPGAVADVHVSANWGKTILIEEKITQDSFRGEQGWKEFALPFTISGGKKDGVETRVFFRADMDLSLDYMRIEPAPEVFDQYLEPQSSSQSDS